MRRIAPVILVSLIRLWAADKNPPSGPPTSGVASNNVASLTARLLNATQLQQAVGSDFKGQFVVAEVTVTPAGGRQLDLVLDNFLMRDSSTGDHSGPLLAAQIAGSGGIVLHRTPDAVVGIRGIKPSWSGSASGSGGSAGTKTEAKKDTPAGDSKPDPMLGILKQKILPEKTISKAETGLLFFPIETSKPKNLELVYSTPSGKLRVTFR